jgi:hypothetical protein
MSSGSPSPFQFIFFRLVLFEYDPGYVVVEILPFYLTALGVPL